MDMEESRSAVIDRNEDELFRHELTGHVSALLTERWDGLGTLDEMCCYAVSGKGKLFRPMLLIESACAVGGTVERVLPAAVGAECGHVASLVHDDIIDNDDMRRGRLSVHRAFNVDNAIVAGDALIFDLFAALAECRETGVPEHRIVSALSAVARAGVDMCRGQVLEAEVSAERRFSVDSYLAVAELKTAALFRGTCQSGALLGEGDDTEVAALAAYGEHLGRAFQIHDDLLVFVSDDATAGKPGGSDLKNGRMTAPVVMAHRLGRTGDRERLEQLLSEPGEGGLDELRDVIERTGALRRTADWAAEWAWQAHTALDVLQPSPYRDRLGRYAEAAINRTR
ncbi:MAG TPA: polyprenyl synthetase family protein [Streptosporangiaceae bacterium]|nr:polyprenyl synthetase family protein [Streptosporangiaceae bacterium]